MSTNPPSTMAATQRPVHYHHGDGVTTVTLDDGKVNAMSPTMQGAIHTALDQAEADGAPVVLLGRPGVFSAGFDLGILGAGGPEATAMVRGGFELSLRLLALPLPVIVGCTGHAIAMGTFLLFSGDYRVGATGDYRLTANEVAIGLTMPHAALAVLAQRLAPSMLNRVAVLAEAVPPSEAVAAGYLDRLVPPDEVEPTARRLALATAGLDLPSHTATKLRLRTPHLEAIRAGIAADEAGLTGAPT